MDSCLAAPNRTHDMFRIAIRPFLAPHREKVWSTLLSQVDSSPKQPVSLSFSFSEAADERTPCHMSARLVVVLVNSVVVQRTYDSRGVYIHPEPGATPASLRTNFPFKLRVVWVADRGCTWSIVRPYHSRGEDRLN